MPSKEATARIKINKLLETAGWRFFADGNAPANIDPTVVDAHAEIMTELLSKAGFIFSFTDDAAGEDQQEAFMQRKFKKFFWVKAPNPLFSARDF